MWCLFATTGLAVEKYNSTPLGNQMVCGGLLKIFVWFHVGEARPPTRPGTVQSTRARHCRVPVVGRLYRFVALIAFLLMLIYMRRRIQKSDLGHSTLTRTHTASSARKLLL